MKLFLASLIGRPTSAAALLVLPGVLGCSLDGTEVSVGSTGQAISLDQCYPAKAQCNGSPATPKSSFDKPMTCSAGSHFALTRFPLPTLPAGYENMLVGPGAVSPDGTIWFTAIGYPKVSTRGLAMHLFLFQVNQEGQELGKIELPLSGDFSPADSLVVDDDGVATVALTDGSMRFYRYATGAKSLGIVGNLMYLPNQLVAADSTTHYLVAGDTANFENRGILGRVNVDGSLERSNNQVPYLGQLSHGSGIVALTSHHRAGYSLLAERLEAEDHYRVVRYNRDLESEWSLPLPEPVSPMSIPTMVSDSAGRLLVSELLDRATFGPDQVGFYGVDASGTGLFSFKLSPVSVATSSWMTAERNTSRVWVNVLSAPFVPPATSPVAGAIVEVDLAQRTCQTHDYVMNFITTALAGGDMKQEYLQSLLVTPRGQVLMLTTNSLMRLEEVPNE